MKINNVELIPHKQTDDFEVLNKQIIEDNMSYERKIKKMRSITFVIGIIMFIISGFYLYLFKNFILLILLPAVAISIIIVGYMIFHDILEENYKEINESLEISYRLQGNKLLQYDTDNMLLEYSDQDNEVSELPLDVFALRLDVVKKTDMQDKVIIDLDKNKVYIPFQR